MDDLNDLDDHLGDMDDLEDHLDDPMEDHLDVHLDDLDDLDDPLDYPLEDHLDDRPAYATGATVQLCCIAASDIRWEIEESKSSLLWKSAFNIAFATGLPPL